VVADGCEVPSCTPLDACTQWPLQLLLVRCGVAVVAMANAESNSYQASLVCPIPCIKWVLEAICWNASWALVLSM
jgi:hypothetical protein